MKIGLVGPSYEQRSLPFDAQRCINLFAISDEQGKETSALYGTPGLSLFSTCGSGPIRGCFAAANDRAFVVSGDKLYEVDSAGTATSRGTLNTSTGNVSMDENGVQLFICDGDDGYTLTYSGDTFAVVSDVDFPSAGSVTYIDGYFIVNQNSSGKFYISSINDGTAWAALDFATAESAPDTLKRPIRAVGQLWLFGSKSTEIWTNTGDSDFPFQKISGAEMAFGIMAPHTAVEHGGTVYWVGENDDGVGIVYRAKGFSPERVSTEAIEIRIREATDKENMTAYSYQEDGHDFYVLTGGGLETTLVYDVSTGLWHERAYLESSGTSSLHLASCCMFIFGKHIVGDRRNGKVYEMSMDYYSDAGDEIARDRIFTHLSDEDKRIRYNKLEIGFETGVGLTSGQGSDPLVSLRLSKDGARTWSDEYTASLGAIGQYQTKVAFRRLGIAEQMTFWIRVTDPVKVAIVGAYLS